MRFFLALSVLCIPATFSGVAQAEPRSATTPVKTEVRVVDGIPVLYANRTPFVLKVWTAGLHLANQSDERVKRQIDWAAASGFNAVEVMAEWRVVESVRRGYDWSRVDALMSHAASMGIYVLLTVEAGYAPAWFADQLHPGAVFVTYDPNPEGHPGMISGRLAAPGVGSLPIFYHPSYWAEADAFFRTAIARYKRHPALFGYDLFVFTTGEYNYPGGGAYGIAGFADYSSYTVGLFSRAPPLPLVEFSQDGPDHRPDWLRWSRFRLDKKREALDHFGQLVKKLDPYHVLVAWQGDAPLWGGWDNGLMAEAGGGDYPYLLTRSYIDVVRAAPQVPANLFEVVGGDLSATPYMLVPTIQAALKHGKLFLLQTERTVNRHAPDLTGRITQWADAFGSLGAQFLWWEEPPGDRDVSGGWTQDEKAEILRTLALAEQPAVDHVACAEFAFIDLPFETAKYYADRNHELLFATKQVHAFLDAGLPYDTLSARDILANPGVMDGYKAVGFLIPHAYDLLGSADLRSLVSTFQSRGGAVWRGDPVDGFNYADHGYADPSYLDSLRRFYDSHNLSRHRYTGYGLQIWGNRPFLFVLSRLQDWSGTLRVALKGWGLRDGPVDVTEINSAKSYRAHAKADSLRLDLTLAKGQPCLFRCAQAD